MEKGNVTPGSNETKENNVPPVDIEKVDDNVTSSESHRTEDENVTPVSHEKKDDKAGAANHATASYQTEDNQRKEKVHKDQEAAMAVAQFLTSVDPKIFDILPYFDPESFIKIMDKHKELKKADALMKYKAIAEHERKIKYDKTKKPDESKKSNETKKSDEAKKYMESIQLEIKKKIYHLELVGVTNQLKNDIDNESIEEQPPM